MTTLRTLPRDPRALPLALAGAVALVTLAASLRFGLVGLLLPVVGALVVVLLQRPALALGLFAGVIVLAEGEDPLVERFYTGVVGPFAVPEALFVLAVVGTVLRLMRERRPVRLPPLLALPLALIGLGMVGGAIVGYYGGASPTDLVFALRQLPYLLVLPLLVVNLLDSRRAVLASLGIAVALGIVKAVLGLANVAAGRGTTVDGSAITYYEPAANFLMMVLLLGVLAAVLMRARLPLWVLLGTPLMVASLALSYRRSFWIGVVLGMALVIVLGSSPLGRRLLLPTAALVGGAIWVLSSVGFQSQSQAPLVERVESLKPSRVEANAEDRYRFDERANVLAELGSHPLTGLGLSVPWSSAARPLPVEHDGGRDYVHSVVLWYWLKLGVIGLVGYLGTMAAAAALAWRAWRGEADARLQAAGLGAFAGLIGLAVIETSGSFTGVDVRFTIVLGMLLGLLAVLGRPALEDEPAV